MAKQSLLEKVQANGLSKKVTQGLQDALGSAAQRSPKRVKEAAAELRKLADELESRVSGGAKKAEKEAAAAKRSAASKKAAATKKKAAAKRSAAAKKGAAKRKAKAKAKARPRS